MTPLTHGTAEKLQRRYPTALSPGASIAIKRNQHEVDVGAEKFAEAFAALHCTRISTHTPELSFHETRTAALAAPKLKELG